MIRTSRDRMRSVAPGAYLSFEANQMRREPRFHAREPALRPTSGASLKNPHNHGICDIISPFRWERLRG
jgi:hypothetical protein